MEERCSTTNGYRSILEEMGKVCASFFNAGWVGENGCIAKRELFLEMLNELLTDHRRTDATTPFPFHRRHGLVDGFVGLDQPKRVQTLD